MVHRGILFNIGDVPFHRDMRPKTPFDVRPGDSSFVRTDDGKTRKPEQLDNYRVPVVPQGVVNDVKASHAATGELVEVILHDCFHEQPRVPIRDFEAANCLIEQIRREYAELTTRLGIEVDPWKAGDQVLEL